MDIIEDKAKSGDAEAQCRLGAKYYGAGNILEAIWWYRKSAEQEYARAQYQLALCYYYDVLQPVRDCYESPYVDREVTLTSAKHWCSLAIKNGIVDKYELMESLNEYRYKTIYYKLV
ncbi:MAG: hypothetical protein K2M75_02490 [Clostridia bacterium]|nr:hypothetical protein [Clostridia bacterium]